MKRVGLGLIFAIGLGLAVMPAASAAPISAAPIAQSATALDQVQHVWYDRFGVWHPNRRAVIVAPPVYVVPPVVVAPACRRTRVWVCGPRGCFWERRCV
ncbi:MAG: hypothetical protein ACXWJW_11310 [Xanthobacteraceae bacterium]